MKDNRPPKEERTLKSGDIREDGMVFLGYKAHIKSGEWWGTPEQLEKNKSRLKAYRKNNQEEINKKQRERLKDPIARGKMRAACKEYHRKHKEKIAERKRKARKNWTDEQRAAEALRNKKCRENPIQKQKRVKYHTERRESDFEFSLKHTLSTRIRRAIKLGDGSKSLSSAKLLGCSIAEVRAHLESQFTDGMTWENHGLHGWHIDHIRPCNSFDLTLDEEQRKCFHYSNLQPLWAEDNLRKSDKWQCHAKRTAQQTKERNRK
jgi:hypothetical protein